MEQAHTRKMAFYAARCEAEGLAFLPLVVDTFGGWHLEALVPITNLGRNLAAIWGERQGSRFATLVRGWRLSGVRQCRHDGSQEPHLVLIS